MWKKSSDLGFRESVKSIYLVKYFDRHKMTTKKYYALSETSAFFWIRNHGRWLVWKIGISFNRKENACEEKAWNFTGNTFVRRNFSKTSCQTVIFRTHIWWVVSETINMDILTWRQYIEENQNTEI